MYEAEGGGRPSDSDEDRYALPPNTYFPTEFAFTVPFALLPAGVAQVLWVVLTFSSLIVAAFLMWDLGADQAPELVGGLIALLLAYSEQLVFYGNLAGFAVAFCVIAVWCFLRNRFLTVGIIAFAISLAVKPHDVVLVWAYFFLAGGLFRRWAVRAAIVVAAVSLPFIWWVTQIAPHWIQELRSNIQGFSLRGGPIDVSAEAISNHGSCPTTQLQSLFICLRDDPHFYNWATYLVLVPMLMIWIVITVRTRLTPTSAKLALAAMAPLSMLLFYHRIYDAKIIVLTIPACALLWAEGGRIGRLALIVTAMGCLFTGDLVWGIYFEILMNTHLIPAVSPKPLLAASINAPLPFTLLIMSVFYLWVYVRRSSQPASSEERADLRYAFNG